MTSMVIFYDEIGDFTLEATVGKGNDDKDVARRILVQCLQKHTGGTLKVELRDILETCVCVCEHMCKCACVCKCVCVWSPLCVSSG